MTPDMIIALTFLAGVLAGRVLAAMRLSDLQAGYVTVGIVLLCWGFVWAVDNLGLLQ